MIGPGSDKSDKNYLKLAQVIITELLADCKLGKIFIHRYAFEQEMDNLPPCTELQSC